MRGFKDNQAKIQQDVCVCVCVFQCVLVCVCVCVCVCVFFGHVFFVHVKMVVSMWYHSCARCRRGVGSATKNCLLLKCRWTFFVICLNSGCATSRPGQSSRALRFNRMKGANVRRSS